MKIVKDINRTVMIGAILFVMATMATDALAIKKKVKSSAESSETTLAAGGDLAWTSRNDYGARTYRRFMPEGIGYLYFPLVQSVYVRPGLRLAYVWDQPEMPQALRIEESDFMASAEAGFLWNWYVVPSLTFGYGYDFRTIKLKTSEPISMVDDRISGKETLNVMYGQMGVGVPVMSGLFLLEPFIRYWDIKTDDRSHWTFGAEATVAIVGG